MALYANEADRIKILCKATNEQMIRGNLQSSALHILVYALSTPALYSEQTIKVLCSNEEGTLVFMHPNRIKKARLFLHSQCCVQGSL